MWRFDGWCQVLKKIYSLFKAKSNKGDYSHDINDLFKYKYTNFKELLNSNTELGRIISDMGQKLLGSEVFGMPYVRSTCSMAISHAQRMVRALNAISNGKYLVLNNVLEGIQEEINRHLKEGLRQLPPILILPYSEIRRHMVDLVGGKNANLGEVFSLGLHVPEGFAITTYAFKVFMESNDLFDLIFKKKQEIDPSNIGQIQELSEEIQRLILTSRVPLELEKAILEAFSELEEKLNIRPLRVAMRSSAIGEDSELSFAGQYVSLLNVPKERLINSYKIIVASLYTPRAISYRFQKGQRVEDIAMAVACIRMIDSRSSGVIYTLDPREPDKDLIVINSTFGLGAYVVDGTITPDSFYVSKTPTFEIKERTISHKTNMLTIGPLGELKDQEIPPEKRDLPSITDEEAQELSRLALLIEKHFLKPQDIEWAIDEMGTCYILQTRPLPLHKEVDSEMEAKEILAPLLLEGGDPAFKGISSGIAYHIRKKEDMVSFPKGGILISPHPSPDYAIIISKAAGIITDKGSVTGHMASIAREFRVPCLLNTKIATKVIPHGKEITLDSIHKRVYEGKVESLLDKKEDVQKPMLGTPVYNTLKKVSEYIQPLNLIDPKSFNFRPDNIKTLHDLMRFVHEKSYEEMFRLSDSLAEGKGKVHRVLGNLPIDLYVIDLGGGLCEIQKQNISLEDITSEPLKALLLGMIKERDDLTEPRPVSFKGLISVLTEQMLSPPNIAVERFGDKSYAIISDKYMNFSSRVGYHYSIIDTYCGDTIAKNYISFYFMGGAADETRRNRRARTIGRILEDLTFQVEVVKDSVSAKILKYEKKEILSRLRELGRLLEFTRQIDMLMDGENSVDIWSKRFFSKDAQKNFYTM